MVVQRSSQRCLDEETMKVCSRVFGVLSRKSKYAKLQEGEKGSFLSWLL
jgi:hypothetical protein